jgi:hypothetical protein
MPNWSTHISRPIPSPDIGMDDESQERIGAPPLGLCLQAMGLEDWQRIDHPSQSLGKNQTLEIASDGFPRLIVGIRESLEGNLGRQKTILRRDVVIGQTRKCGKHLDGGEARWWRRSVVGELRQVRWLVKWSGEPSDKQPATCLAIASAGACVGFRSSEGSRVSV